MQVKARQWYKPWGEVRQVTGEMPTDYQFTGQRKDSSIGMLWYGSRFYDAALGRFSQPDSIVPNTLDPPSFDRYAFVRSNPIKYMDPNGHRPVCDDGSNDCDDFRDWIMERRMLSPSVLSLSSKGLDFIINKEGGLIRNPYNDALDPLKDDYYWDRTGKGAGDCTGGYGHRIHNGPCDGRPQEDRFVDISEEKALEILKGDINAAEAVVKQHITAALTQTQYDALVSLCFNSDCAAHPTKINLINAGNSEAAGLHFLKGPNTSNGKIMNGLLKRRYEEAEMFLTGYSIILPTLEEYLANPLLYADLYVDLLP